MEHLHKALPLPALALASVVSKDGSSVYASSDRLFKGAVFGRDSLEVAEDLMFTKPALAHNILLTMGRLQGVARNKASEEEPGKTIHEYRNVVIDDKPINGVSRTIFDELSSKWGGNGNELAYYGSVDATPQFLRALGTYCINYGEAILDEKVVQRNGKTFAMRQAAEAAAAWTVKKLSGSESGLLEFRKINPHGISNQVWKDSEEFYVHEDAVIANHDRPIASIEVQGLAYDALLAAARFFPKKATDYLEQALQLRDRTIELLWQPERQYFALGLDYDEKGRRRIIQTATANPAGLLDTHFFDDLEPAERDTYVTALVRRIMDKDFLTSAGIRSRSLQGAHLIPFWDYHGSYVSWPKETYDIAKGLRRQGLPKLAYQLENRLLNLVLKTRDYPEFVYVDEGGRVLAGAPHTHPHGELVLVEGTNEPERLQAWTVSAVMAIISNRGLGRRKRNKPLAIQPPAGHLQDEILAKIPHLDVYINPLKLLLQYPTHKYHLSGKKS
jgi:glycogen debranching enzyme